MKIVATAISAASVRSGAIATAAIKPANSNSGATY